jgi:heat shock protein HslJ
MLLLRRVQVLLIGGLLVLAGACSPGLSEPGTQDPAQNPIGATETPRQSTGLANSEWVLERYGPVGNESELLPGSTITLHFEKDRLGGTAGCNSYFGDYHLTGDSISVGPLGSTEMWCDGLMDQGDAYLDLLGAVETVAHEGQRLILSGPAGWLVFAEQSPVADRALVETVWELQTIITGDTARSVLPGSLITVEFEADGRVSGFAGCNSFSSTYMLDEKGLGFHIFTTTLMACQDSELMDQESLFLNLLQESTSLSLEGDQLTISSDESDLIFRPVSHLSLEETDWVLTGIATGGAVVQNRTDEMITARFADGMLAGSTGCNSYSATYEIAGKRLSLGPVNSTRRACADEIMQRESEFLEALGRVTSFETRLDALMLYDSQGQVLIQFQEAQ